MPHKTPQFPLACKIIHDPLGPLPHAPVTTVCQLRSMSGYWGLFPTAIGGGNNATCIMYFPKGTDVRDLTDVSAGGADAIEMPPGSGSLYAVQYVADEARGFPNEFRWAAVFHTLNVSQPRP
jgi:hypothetical protein